MKINIPRMPIRIFSTVAILTLTSGIAFAASDNTPVDEPGSAEQNIAGFNYPLELKFDPSRISFSRAKYLPLPPEGKVTVQLLGTSIDAAIPGEFKFFLATEDSGGLFTTVSVPAGQAVPKGQELVDGIAFVEPGVWYTLVVVYENPTDETVDFYVSAPSVDPEAAFPFARALCWCAAVPFSAPAGGSFYRTIKVGVGIKTPAGARAIVDWPIVQIIN
jgi:hypothetical protein